MRQVATALFVLAASTAWAQEGTNTTLQQEALPAAEQAAVATPAEQAPQEAPQTLTPSTQEQVASSEATSQTSPQAPFHDEQVTQAPAAVQEAQTTPAAGANEAECANATLGCIVSETHPLKLAILERNKGLVLAKFRKSDNMPDVVNEDFLRGRIDNEKIPKDLKSVRLGYLPKLKIIPCDVGCSGSDYEKVAKRIIKGYEASGAFETRGEMPVKIRWYRYRNFVERMVPMSSDEVGVSFMLEGKMVSFGERTLSGSRHDALDMAEIVGGKLAAQLIFTLGIGIKPPYLSYDVANVAQWAVALDSTVLTPLRSVEKVFGRDDLRLQIAPVPQNLAASLSPPVDGILPGEVNPIETTLIPINDRLF